MRYCYLLTLLFSLPALAQLPSELLKEVNSKLTLELGVSIDQKGKVDKEHSFAKSIVSPTNDVIYIEHSHFYSDNKFRFIDKDGERVYALKKNHRLDASEGKHYTSIFYMKTSSEKKPILKSLVRCHIDPKGESQDCHYLDPQICKETLDRLNIANRSNDREKIFDFEEVGKSMQKCSSDFLSFQASYCRNHKNTVEVDFKKDIHDFNVLIGDGPVNLKAKLSMCIGTIGIISKLQEMNNIIKGCSYFPNINAESIGPIRKIPLAPLFKKLEKPVLQDF
jgi:hypothetical protein